MFVIKLVTPRMDTISCIIDIASTAHDINYPFSIRTLGNREGNTWKSMSTKRYKTGEVHMRYRKSSSPGRLASNRLLSWVRQTLQTLHDQVIWG